MSHDRVLASALSVVKASSRAETICRELHFWIMLLLVSNGGVGPGVMEGNGHPTYDNHILTFLTHILGQVLHVQLPKLLIVDHLDVPGVALLVGRLVGNDGNACLLGAFEHRL